MFFSKAKITSVILAIFIFAFSLNTFAQFVDNTTLGTVSAQENTGDKPQSKVWYHDGYWWTVIPESNTYIYRLDGATWTRDLELSGASHVHADTKVEGDITYIFLYDGASSSQLVVAQYSSATHKYSLLNTKSITLDNNVETATIDIDSQGIMWLASDGGSSSNGHHSIYVRYSEDAANYYSSWSSNIITLADDTNDDDICSIIAFDNKIGVLWSNQHDDQFHFSYHVNSEDPTTWYGPELASPGQSGSFSDDHINLAASSDGTIYAAVKTSYDSGSDPTIALLVRSNDGTWNIYDVTNSGATRPIVLLDDTNHKIYVMYTTDLQNSANIGYKYASTSDFSFITGSNIANGSFNNITSTKQNFSNEVVLLYSNGSTWYGKIEGTSPLPVELVAFSGTLNNDNIELYWNTATEVNNYGFNIERAYNNDEWSTIGFVEGNGNSNSPKEYYFYDSNVNQPGKYSYRLKQIDNDGAFEYSDTVTINVSTPNGYYLSQNYPNPFNPSTTINYTITNDEKVSLKVYDLLGREVASLVDGYKPAGNYSVSFNANELASGVYIYRLVAGGYVSVKRMSLIK